MIPTQQSKFNFLILNISTRFKTIVRIEIKIKSLCFVSLKMDIPIGIDLGTTNTCAAIWCDGKAIILSEMPSCVSFTENGYHVGQNSGIHRTNTIVDAKRLIGQNFKTAANFAKYWPFVVVDDGSGIPQYEVECQHEMKYLYAEQISALVLKKVKEDVEIRTRQRIENVVITVPAYFNETQRESTRIAASLAGLSVLKIITEPAAAALAYGTRIEVINEHNVLIYDIGKPNSL